MNMACRNWLLRNETLDKLKSVFNLVLTKKLTEDVNEVIMAFPSNRMSVLKTDFLNTNGTVSERLQSTVECLQGQVVDRFKDRSAVDLIKAIEGLTLS